MDPTRSGLGHYDEDGRHVCPCGAQTKYQALSGGREFYCESCQQKGRTMPETRLVNVGDRFMETTPSGRKIPLTVLEVDVEPKYPLDSDRSYLRLSREHTSFVMSERVLLDVDWIESLSDERNAE